MGWNDPLTTLWVQRDGAAELTIGGLTVNDLPVYVLSLPVDETGKVLHIQDSSFLEEGKGYNEEKVLRFLKSWTPQAVKG